MSNNDFEEIFSTFAMIFSSTVLVVIFAIVAVIAFLFFVAAYVLSCLGIYRMAKKLNYEKPWLAWIPFANTWLMFNLPKNEYRVLALKKVIPDRTNAFWIFLAVNYGIDIVMTILKAIPVVQYVAAVISPIVGIVASVAYVFMGYPMYHDLYRLFLPKGTAKGFSIASVVGALVFPILPPVLMFIASCKEPIEVEDADYVETVAGEVY